MNKVIAISKRTRTYTPPCCEGIDPAPEFLIRSTSRDETLLIEADNPISLKGAQMKPSEDGKSVDLIDTGEINYGQMSLATHRRNVATVKLGCSGWKNISDEDGEAVPFAPENIDLLDGEVVKEVADAIAGKISRDEAKNSEAPSSAGSGGANKPDGTVISAEGITSEGTGTAKE